MEIKLYIDYDEIENYLKWATEEDRKYYDSKMAEIDYNYIIEYIIEKDSIIDIREVCMIYICGEWEYCVLYFYISDYNDPIIYQILEKEEYNKRLKHFFKKDILYYIREKKINKLLQ